jgi:hypothetical protein
MVAAVLTDAQRQALIERALLPLRTRDIEGREVTERSVAEIKAALELADSQASTTVTRNRIVNLVPYKGL